MDSREIYIQTRRQIEWEENWIHIGTGNDINLDLIKNQIAEHLEGLSEIQLKRGRLKSQTLQKKEVIDVIIKYIGDEEFE